MQLSDNISCFSQPQKSNIFGIPNTTPKYSKKKVTHTKPIMPEKSEVVDFAYKMTYPGKEAYHFPSGKSHTSPCMDPYWRAKPIREGNVRDEIDRDEKPEEGE